MTCTCENGQLRVILSEAETIKYNIDCVFFEYGSKKADKALVSVLKIAASTVGFKTDSIKYLIEIYPVFDGGCEIFYIPDRQSNKKRISAIIKHHDESFLIYEFEDCEDMLSSIEMLYRQNLYKYIESSLFELNNRYRLLLSGTEYNGIPSLCEFCKRYFTRCIDRAKTLEYWNLIAKDTAIETLGKAFCRR